jgi:hypothetical protein
MRPLSVKTIIPCRTDRSILKVIVMLFGPSSRGVAAFVAIALSVDEDATRRPHAGTEKQKA